MVATIDGKILSGERDDPVVDLGSAVDHSLMGRITRSSDAVLVGAATLRATMSSWDPGTAHRIVVSASGNVPFGSKFFTSGKGHVAAADSANFELPANVSRISAGETKLDFRLLGQRLRAMGIGRLAILGGSEINAQFLHAGLVDELFLTIAPKVKLGRDVPTYADGEALPKDFIQKYRIVEHHVIGDEVFLRYRRAQTE